MNTSHSVILSVSKSRRNENKAESNINEAKPSRQKYAYGWHHLELNVYIWLYINKSITALGFQFPL